MSERDEKHDHAITFATASPVPCDWFVECQTCGETTECSMSQNDSGIYVPDNGLGDPFVTCTCGTVIEAGNVTISPAK